MTEEIKDLIYAINRAKMARNLQEVALLEKALRYEESKNCAKREAIRKAVKAGKSDASWVRR